VEAVEMPEYVYNFVGGGRELVDLLGGKGANLAEMKTTVGRADPLAADAAWLIAETTRADGVEPGFPDAGTTAPGQEPSVDAGFGAAVRLAGPEPAVLVPVSRSGRPVGAFLVIGATVRYRPVVDLDQVLSAGLAALAVTAVAASVVAGGRRRRSPAIGAVTMGPGGWVSLKGVTPPILRPARRAGRRSGRTRPLWARLLRARRLVVDR
jgi:hypothetical protein